MSVHTRSQKLAQAAFSNANARRDSLNENDFKEYISFAKKFPALMHTCGLAQAVAFALAKAKGERDCIRDYIDDLAALLNAGGYSNISSASDLLIQTQTLQIGEYLRLSIDTINAASWLKRYAEAVAGGEE